MHRSSESVAAIATALAKAQTELSNPEKAMVGTVYHNRSDTSQSFRYASLSSGLEIIRKTLGGYQIAIAQTTDIDRPSGAVNLTTVLMHSSGEWIASDWPVCALSEISQPRRMGAALTYARRYALFTMVGIAGEDDLDAPEITNDQPKADKADAPGVVLSRSEPPSTSSSQFRTGNPSTPPVREKLGVEESATIRTQLIQEIETLPEADLQPRAIAILKAKNRLSVEDAKRVEEAFEARMAQQGASPEVQMTDEPAFAPTDPTTPPQPHLATPAAVTPRRPRGRPRKVKAAIEPPAVLAVPSTPTSDDDAPPASIDLKAGTTSAKIQKSELAISEPRRHRDKAHLKFVASHPCLVCGRSPADAHHLRFTQPRAMGRKVSDEFTVPLCRTHHRDNHQFGDEVAWWGRRAIDPIATSRMLWVSTRRIE
jgi:ERF superfamily